MSFSAGIAHSPTAGADRDAFVMAADKAMYTAKRSGKGAPWSPTDDKCAFPS